jgi:hypothetical protein
MNRFERYQPARFWKGVAQITRNRDRAFIASLCSRERFSISSIWRADRCEGSRFGGFPLLDLDPGRIERPKATTRCKNDTLGHQLTVAASAVISYRQPHRRAVRSRQWEGFACRVSSPQRRVPYRERRDCRNPYFAGSKYHSDASRQLPMCLSIARSSELKLVLWRFPKSPKGFCESSREIRAASPPSGHICDARHDSGGPGVSRFKDSPERLNWELLSL